MYAVMDVEMLLDQGIDLFNRRYFFEAHDVWEEAWKNETGEPRRFLQGLIQVAAGFHHRETGNLKGAAALFQKAKAKFDGYPAAYLGIDLGALLRDVAESGRELDAADLGPGHRAYRTQPHVRTVSESTR